MKDGDSTAARRAPEASEGFTSRKLIRPVLSRPEGRGDRDGRERRPETLIPTLRKPIPAEQTHAENFYYQKQMAARTPLVVVLQDGEELEGVIEWYDRNCIKMTVRGHVNTLIYKPSIKYIYKASEHVQR